MPNIQFNYLYRDGGNYKNFSFAIFANPENIELQEIEKLIRSKLIYHEWFYAEEWGLPEISLDSFDFKTDPNWHEFESIEFTDHPPTQSLSIGEFIQLIDKPNQF